jgi:uncharacterized protein YbjT (DUF2867 family)
MAYKTIIAGASGLVGSALLQILLEQPEYNEVVALVRKELPVSHHKLVQVVMDFDQLHKYTALLKGHALFCCLGSTRKKTPDLADYRKVDFDYPVALAEIALANQVSQYHLISAIGADYKSSNFYTKLKGETEQAIESLQLKCLHIYQPSLLVGLRKENRLMERIAIITMRVLNPLLRGNFKKYRSIKAKTVAFAMFKQSLQNREGVFVHPSDHIKQLA